MRPKVVILTMVVAFGLLGLMAFLKGMAGKNSNGGDAGDKAVAQAPVTSNSASTSNQTTSLGGDNKPVVVSEQMRQAVIDKENEQIHDLQGQVDGTNNPLIIAALIDKLSDPEAEVRHTALEALKELNDTNAIPGLEKAADNIKDAREKVAVLDTIDYIKMPSVTDNVAPELATNYTAQNIRGPISTNIQFNPEFLKGNKNFKTRSLGQDTTPPGTPAGQSQ